MQVNSYYKEAEIKKSIKEIWNKMTKLAPSTIIRIVDGLVNSLDIDSVLVEKLTDKKELEKYLFNYKQIDVVKHNWVRNTEGHIEAVESVTKKVLPTSDGSKQLLDLIGLMSTFKSQKLKKVLANAIMMTVDKNNNDEAYYCPVVGGSEKRVIDTDFSEIYKKYMELPKELQTKEAMIAMFKRYEIISELEDGGYRAAKELFENYSLTEKDIKVLSDYIYSRLERIEERVLQLGTKDIDAVKKVLANVESGKKVDDYAVNLAIKKLKEVDSDKRLALVGKYNQELQRYKKILRPIHKKHELDAEDKNNEISELFKEIGRTSKIINDESIIANYESYIEILEEYLQEHSSGVDERPMGTKKVANVPYLSLID